MADSDNEYETTDSESTSSASSSEEMSADESSSDEASSESPARSTAQAPVPGPSSGAVGPFGLAMTPMFPFPTMPHQPAQRVTRRQVKVACTNCRKAAKKCDDGRPCMRCVKYGIAESCRDSKRKQRAKGLKRGPYKTRRNDNRGQVASNSSGSTTTTITTLTSTTTIPFPYYHTPGFYPPLVQPPASASPAGMMIPPPNAFPGALMVLPPPHAPPAGMMLLPPNAHPGAMMLPPYYQMPFFAGPPFQTPPGMPIQQPVFNPYAPPFPGFPPYAAHGINQAAPGTIYADGEHGAARDVLDGQQRQLSESVTGDIPTSTAASVGQRHGDEQEPHAGPSTRGKQVGINDGQGAKGQDDNQKAEET